MLFTFDTFYVNCVKLNDPKELKRKKSLKNSPPQANFLKKFTFAGNFGKFSRHAVLNLGGVLPPVLDFFKNWGEEIFFGGNSPPPAYRALHTPPPFQ